MADHGLAVEILTPESALFAGEAVAVVAKTSEGDLTIMADHAELIGDVVPGVITLQFESDDPISILVHGGFLQVTTAPGGGEGLVDGASETDRITRVTILAGIAEPGDQFDLRGPIGDPRGPMAPDDEGQCRGAGRRAQGCLNGPGLRRREPSRRLRRALAG